MGQRIGAKPFNDARLRRRRKTKRAVVCQFFVQAVGIRPQAQGMATSVSAAGLARRSATTKGSRPVICRPSAARPRPHRPNCGDGGKIKHMGLGRISLDQEVEVHQFALKKEAAKVQGQGRPKSVGKPRQSWPIGATSTVEGQPYQQFGPVSTVQIGGKLGAMLPNQFIDREAKQAFLKSQSIHL